MTKRIFIFGCSFTRYYWPTWADFVAFSNPEIEVFNMGKIGLGNTRIFQRIQEMHLDGTIQPEDQIMISWTGRDREDRYVNGKWDTGGKTIRNPSYGPEFTEKYCDPEFMGIKSASAIIAANQIYNVTWNGGMCPFPYDTIPPLYHPHLPQIKSFWDISLTRFGDRSKDDLHPDVYSHAVYYRKFVGMNAPDWNRVNDLNKQITHAISPEMDRWKVREIATELSLKVFPSWNPIETTTTNLLC